MASDLERAFGALTGKKEAYDRLFRYYDGDQPLVYSAERLREVFQRLDAKFCQNWCALVVDAVMERLNLTGIAVEDKAAQEVLNAAWDTNHLEIDSDDTHTAALIAGESFIVAWPDENGQPEAYFHDPRMCHVFYDADHPRRKVFAAKWWKQADERVRMTLYYPGRIEQYLSRSKQGTFQKASDFVPMEPPSWENPYGVVPVFHFQRSLRSNGSELLNVTPLQDAVNKLLADMMVAAEFGAFKQRWVISNAENIGALKNSPNEVWDLPAGDGVGQQTQVGEFGPTDLSNFLGAIDKLTNTIAIITRTPKHYFMDGGANLSGEALLAMEAPLNSKCRKYQELWTPVWKELAAFLLRIGGLEVDEGSIQPTWQEARTIQPHTEAQIRKLNVEAGIPLVTTLRREGWGEDDMAQLLQDQAEAAAGQQASLATALVEAQRRMDQGGNDVTGRDAG
jgi:hypothetical protein